ncbi:hypothetical protein [Ralstonia solanacearum]|uniref:hypothetical protein n=1 Tax=Ralstonia solanacearum TaxID=305 RepID=UPI001E2DA2DC|nr:hypothetical protein [Ralstonia solanacearum]
MRDVTDNVTADLPGVERKRGRGRPRTGHAMSNAERQAAYRARRQAERAADRGVTVTKKPADVDAYDECRLEVESLRAELVATCRQVELAESERNKAFELADLKCDQHQEALDEVQRLKGVVESERALANHALKSMKLPVTPSNGNPVSFDVMLDLISLAAKANTFEQRRKVRDTVLWFDTFVRARLVSEAQMRAAGEAIYGERKVVTRKE